MSDYLIQQETMEAIANQVRRLSNTDDLYNAVEIIEILSKITGSLDTTVGDIVIEAIDYDGTVLKSSTLCEGQVFAMPDPPSHEGLIFQGWTAPTTAINFVTAGSVGFSIGAMYSTESGATEIDVITTEDNQDVNIPNHRGSNVTYDWGDGSTDAGNHHIYSNAGNYTIRIFNVTEISNQGGDISPIVEIRLGDSVTTINNRAFSGSGINKISLSKNIETLGYGVFRSCLALKTIILPPKITEFQYSDMFNGCTLLEKVILPSNLKVFGGNYFFKGCENLSNIILPNTIESVNSGTTMSHSVYGENIKGTYLEDNMCYFSSIDNKKFVLSNIILSTSGTIIDIVIPDEVCIIQDGLLYYNNANRINKLTVPDNVKKIPKEMCKSSNLKEISLPSGITEIGSEAFYGCYYIETLNIPDSIKSIGSNAFSYCKKLKSFNLTDNLISIGYGAFSDCTSLENITIPSTVKSLGGNLFNNCTSLKKADLSLVTIDDDSSININNLFYGCTSLTDVSLPSGITEINYRAFYGCTGLTTIQIPDSVTTIENHAFGGCTNLTEITLPDSLTSLDNCPFYNCTSLKSLHIPANVNKILYNPVVRCTNLESITVDENNTKYVVENGMLFKKGYTYIVLAMTKDAVIPTDGTVKYLGEGLFYNDEYLISYIVPEGIIGIDEYCFGHCKNLKSITLSSTLKYIDWYAFWECSSLTSITIPKSVTRIGSGAFGRCYDLTSAIYEGTEEEWANVTVESGNEYLTNVISFTETTETTTE